MVNTSWNDSKVSCAFEAYQDILEQFLGYRYVFQELNLENDLDRCVLDYGCGPGKVAFRLAQEKKVSVLAVDTSLAMLEIAQKKRTYPSIIYRLIDDGILNFLGENSMDGAIACYVFINIASETRIQCIIQEIYRILKPGAPFIILDTNPSSTGREFSTFRNGRPGKIYEYGERREEWLHVQGQSDLVLHDYHWPKAMYLAALKKAKFIQIEQYEPIVSTLSQSELRAFEASYGSWEWKEEWLHPPFVIFRAIKGNMLNE